MDPLSVFNLALRLAPYIGQFKDAIDEATSNDDLVTKIGKVATPFVPLLEQLGQQFFPQAASQIHIAAVVMSQFDPSTTKWLQKSLNQLLAPSPNLVVDGQYGPRTKAAVEQLQAKLGLKVDGWAGQLTQAAIKAALAASH